MKRCLLVVVVVAACKSSSGTQPAAGSAGEQEPSDAAVGDASSSLPACKQTATFDVLPPGPTRGAGALVGNELFVGSLSDARYNLSVFDVTAHAWHELPPVTLGPTEQRTHFMQFATAQGLELLTDGEKDDRVFVHTFDRASRRWLAVTSTPPSALHYLQFPVANTIVWIPYQRCGPHAFDKTLVLRANKLVGAPAHLSPRARTAIEAVGNKLVVWGGEAIASPPADSHVDCKSFPRGTPLTDGAVLDPSTGTWKPIAAGPPALADTLSFAVGDTMLVYGLAGSKPALWRYDLGTNTWTEVRGTPTAHSGPWHREGLGNLMDIMDLPSEAHAGSTVVLNRGGDTPAQDVVDLDAATVRAGPPLPMSTAAFVAVDKTHVLAIPRTPVPPKATAYLEDLQTLTWCELPWIDRAPFYTPKKLPGIGVAQNVGDKLLVWLDGAAYGYIATVH